MCRTLVLFSLTTVCWELALLIVCAFADRVQRTVSGGLWRAAVFDSTVHGTIGFLSWAVLTDCSPSKPRDLLQCLLCGILAMALDVDHFLAAESFSLKKAVSLSRRPPLHATTLIPPLAGALYLTGHLLWPRFATTPPLMLITAWLSHHVRDGLRRGLWLWPLLDSPPLPYWFYLTLTVLNPLIIKLLINLCSVDSDGRQAARVDTVLDV